MMDSAQIALVDRYLFTCLPREVQRVISLERLAVLGWRDPVSDTPGHKSSAKRYEHYATRVVAAQLLEAQGAGDAFASRGADPDRAPQWPPGFVGSITHSARFAAVAVMPQSMARAVGIDAESVLTADQQVLVRQYCAVDDELDALARGASALSEAQILTLCFSAKEAVFKCLYPLVKRYFDFTCVRIVAVDESTNLLSIEVVDKEIARCAETSALTGSFQFAEGHVFTAFWLAPR